MYASNHVQRHLQHHYLISDAYSSQGRNWVGGQLGPALGSIHRVGAGVTCPQIWRKGVVDRLLITGTRGICFDGLESCLQSGRCLLLVHPGCVCRPRLHMWHQNITSMGCGQARRPFTYTSGWVCLSNAVHMPLCGMCRK